MSSISPFFDPTVEVTQFEELRKTVETEFEVEDGFMEYGIPTFYVKLQKDSKQAFLRLFKRLDATDFVPILRRKEEKVVLQIASRPPVRPSRKIINIALLLATVGTVFISGYFLSAGNFVSAVIFAAAIMAVLGSHEMGHKLFAGRHDVEATYPYFIPGPPPIGTFGAIIQQKSLPPNRDALFDVGFAGPVMGFLVSVIITIIAFGLATRVTAAPPDSAPWPFPNPLLIEGLFVFVITFFPLSGSGDVILLPPIAVALLFAGWVGMLNTMLNLAPVGQFDGGHIARGLVGKRAHRIISYLGIVLLAIIWYPMALIAIFFSLRQHPGPLDDVSQPTTSRKLATLALIAIFIVSIVPISQLLI